MRPSEFYPKRMTKTINTTKLETLGIDKARKACLIHATAAINARERGDDEAFGKHSDLLDQCAAVGRKILHGKVTELRDKLTAVTAIRRVTQYVPQSRWAETDIV